MSAPNSDSGISVSSSKKGAAAKNATALKIMELSASCGCRGISSRMFSGAGRGLPLLPEIVDTQGGRQAAAALFLYRGSEQHNGRNDKGKRLVQLGGNRSQPAQCAREGGGQAAAGDPEGIEEAEHKRTDDGKRGIPVGKDDQRHSDPAIAVDPAAGVKGAGHVQTHIVAADAHDAAAQADMQVFHPVDIDTHGVSCTGILAHGPELQAGGGMVQIPVHGQRNGNAQIDQDVVAEQALAHQRQFGKHGNGQAAEAVLDGGIIAHDGPAGGLQAVAHKEVDTQAEGGKGQTGDILIGLERDGHDRKQQTAQSCGEECHQNAHGQRIGIAAADVAENGTDCHDSLHAQIQAAGLFHHDLSHGTVQQRDIIHDDVVHKGSQNAKLIHFHCCFLLSDQSPPGNGCRNLQPAPGTGSRPGAYWQSWSPPGRRWLLPP